MRFFATAAKGTEPALRDELRRLRFRGVRADRGGVHFEGELREGLRACLWSAVAMRVLLWVAELPAPSGDALYEGVRGVDLRPFVGPRTSLAVRAYSRASALAHTQFIAQRTKDAVVDPIRERTGSRPDVNLDDPDVRLFVHIVRDSATLYVDLSGEPLHLRGYRREMLDAPLKETLAAAIVALSGWKGTTPFYDPMCGTGTLAIEAALLASRSAPNGRRARFGAERWAELGDEARLAARALRDEAQAQKSLETPPIFASDMDAHAVDATRVNARAAGVTLQAERRRVHELAPSKEPGVIATNPPYGLRLQDEKGLYAAMAQVFAARPAQTLALIAGTPRLEAALPRRPDRWYALKNGDLECRLFVLDPR